MYWRDGWSTERLDRLLFQPKLGAALSERRVCTSDRLRRRHAAHAPGLYHAYIGVAPTDDNSAAPNRKRSKRESEQSISAPRHGGYPHVREAAHSNNCPIGPIQVQAGDPTLFFCNCGVVVIAGRALRDASRGTESVFRAPAGCPDEILGRW